MDEKEEFIAKLYPAARRISEETGMSWELILAKRPRKQVGGGGCFRDDDRPFSATVAI